MRTIAAPPSTRHIKREAGGRPPMRARPLLLALLLAAPAGLLILTPTVRAADHPVEIRGPAACQPSICDFNPTDCCTPAVRLGDTVIWTNIGSGTHSVVTYPDQPESFDSGQILSGGTYQRAFTVPGLYRYLCGVHGDTMRNATVTVVNAVPSVAITSPSSGSSVFGPTTVSGTASDSDSAIARVEVNTAGTWEQATSGDNWATWSFSFSASGAHGSTVNVQARATDAFGAVSAVRSVSPVINRVPVPGFTFTPASPTSSDPVLFTDTSTDPDNATNPGHGVTGRSWRFEDGFTATTPNVTRTLAPKGDRVVNLTATDDDGGSATLSRTIQVRNSAPRPDFTLSTPAPAVNVSLTFQDTTTDPDGGGDLASWAWDFGDGATSTARNATHTYTAPGDYQVRLNVTDLDAAVGSLTRTVTVTQFATALPNASLTANRTSGFAPLAVRFSVAANDTDGFIVNWTLTYGDGETFSGPGAALPLEVEHTYARNGTYSASLLVFDNASAPGVARVTITAERAPNRPPIVVFGVAPTIPSLPGTAVRKGTAVVFADNSFDADVDDAPASWNWSFGDGSRDCCARQRVTHTYTRVGNVLANLTVTDRFGGAASRSIAITVAGFPPRVALAATTTSGRAPFVANFSLDAQDTDGTIARWSFDHGDASRPAEGSGTPPTQLTHVYDQAGVYAPVLTAWDDDNQSSVASLTLTVNPRAPEPFTLPPSGLTAVPLDQRFTYRFSVVATIPGATAYKWTFGDGHTGSGREVVYTYDTPGTYAVNVTVEGNGTLLARGSLSHVAAEEARAPRGRVQAEVASGVVRVSWDPDPRAAGYQVWRAPGDERFEELAVVTGRTTYDDLDVRDGVPYAYRVTFFGPGSEGRLTRLSQLNASEGRLLGETRVTGLVDSDGDGVGDSRDAFPQDAGRFAPSGFPWAWVLLALLVVAAGLAWRYRERLRVLMGGAPRAWPLTSLLGLTSEHAAILRGAGVADTAALAAADLDYLSQATVLPRRQLAPWQDASRLLAVPGLTPVEAMALVRAGVRSPEELARADPAALARSATLPDHKVVRLISEARRLGGRAA